MPPFTAEKRGAFSQKGFRSLATIDPFTVEASAVPDVEITTAPFTVAACTSLASESARMPPFCPGYEFHSRRKAHLIVGRRARRPRGLSRACSGAFSDCANRQPVRTLTHTHLGASRVFDHGADFYPTVPGR